MTPVANEIPPSAIGITGSAGAIVSNALVYTLDVVKTRLQVQMKTTQMTSFRRRASGVYAPLDDIACYVALLYERVTLPSCLAGWEATSLEDGGKVTHVAGISNRPVVSSLALLVVP